MAGSDGHRRITVHLAKAGTAVGLSTEQGFRPAASNRRTIAGPLRATPNTGLKQTRISFRSTRAA